MRATTGAVSDGMVIATGKVVFVKDGGYSPLASAKVYLMDADGDADDVMAVGFTDTAGRFRLQGKGGDPRWLGCDAKCSKPDPYIRVELANGMMVVENEIGVNWTSETEPHEDRDGFFDFGTLIFGGGSRTSQAVARLFTLGMEDYRFFQQWTGQSRIPLHDGVCHVLFPAHLAAGVPFTTEESVHWPPSEVRWEEMHHEFGHRIRHGADGDMRHFLGDVVRFFYLQQHDPEKHTNRGYAFNEGWADYFASLLISKRAKKYAKWKEVAGGDETEGNVTAKLLRLGAQCGGFPTMWRLLSSRRNYIHSYVDFERELFQRFGSRCRGGPPKWSRARVPRFATRPLSRGPTAARPKAGIRLRWTPRRRATAIRIGVPRPPLRANAGQQLQAVFASLLAQNLERQTKLAGGAILRHLKGGGKLLSGFLLKLAGARAAWARNVGETIKREMKAIPAMGANPGAYYAARRRARQRLLRVLGDARLSMIRGAKEAIAKVRRFAPAGLRPYLDDFSTKYRRLEATIVTSLRGLRGAKRIRIPAALLPRGLSLAASRRR